MTTLMQTRSPASAIDGVEEAFSAIGTDAELSQLKGGPSYPVLSGSHLQGVSRYKDLLLITQNYEDGKSGKLYVYGGPGFAEFKQQISLKWPDGFDHDGKYNHPGGIQVFGDYLLAPVQNQKFTRSYVQLWDLSSLGDGTGSISLLSDDFIPGSSDANAGALGICQQKDKIYVVQCNNSNLKFYATNAPLTKDSVFEDYGSAKLDRSASSVYMIPDTDGITYMVSFSSTYDSSKATYRDKAYLYRIDGFENDIKQVNKVEYHCKSNTKGIAGAHFRWGAGVDITDAGVMNLICTQRAMTDSVAFNRFAPGS